MNCLASKRIYLMRVAQSYFSSTIRETVRLCLGESEIPQLRQRCHQQLWSLREIVKFYNRVLQFGPCRITTFLTTSFLRGCIGDQKIGGCLHSTNTFEGRSQCRCCFLVHYLVRLWCSHRRWPQAAAIPVQIRWNSTRVPTLAQGRWRVLIRRHRRGHPYSGRITWSRGPSNKLMHTPIFVPCVYSWYQQVD